MITLLTVDAVVVVKLSTPERMNITQRNIGLFVL